MVHQLYLGDVAAGEKVENTDVARLGAYRVKTSNGHYVHVLASSAEAAAKWAEDHAAEARAQSSALPDYASLARELAELRAWVKEQQARPAVAPTGPSKLDAAAPGVTTEPLPTPLAEAFPGVTIHGGDSL